MLDGRMGALTLPVGYAALMHSHGHAPRRFWRSVQGFSMTEHLLTIRQAAERWGITYQAVDNWIRGGKLAIFTEVDGQRRANASDVQKAKVIRRNDVPTLAKIPRAALGGAERRGLVTASADDRFSLDDIALVASLHRGALAADITPDGGAPTAASAPVEQGSAEERARLYQAYALGKIKLRDFPRWFWDTETCPPFLGKAGMFHYELAGPYCENGQIAGWYVNRSAGWDTDGNSYYYVPAQTPEREVYRNPDPNAVLLFRAEQNIAWVIAEEEWVSEWERHRGASMCRKASAV